MRVQHSESLPFEWFFLAAFCPVWRRPSICRQFRPGTPDSNNSNFYKRIIKSPTLCVRVGRNGSEMFICAMKPWNAAHTNKCWSSMEIAKSVKNAGTSRVPPGQSDGAPISTFQRHFLPKFHFPLTPQNFATRSAMNWPVLVDLCKWKMELPSAVQTKPWVSSEWCNMRMVTGQRPSSGSRRI